MINRLPLIVCGLLATVAVDGSAGNNKAASRSNTADLILQNLRHYIGSLKSFNVDAEVWQDYVMDEGQKVQVTREVSLDVRRPNKLHATVHSPLLNKEYWYDGKNLSLLEKKTMLYGRVDAPETIDKMVDFVSDRYGIEVPLLDLAVSDPYDKRDEPILSTVYAGKINVMGTPCKYVLVRAADVDYQLWVEDGPQELPKKIVINYKHEEGQPQFIVLFRHWNTDAHLPLKQFVFVPPRGSSKIRVVESDNSG